jgi:hypothetical protein
MAGLCTRILRCSQELIPIVSAEHLDCFLAIVANREPEEIPE